MIPLIKPKLPALEAWAPYIERSYATGAFANGGPCVRQLEDRFQSYLRLGQAPILMCNATTALTVALQAFELQGSDVLLPTFTFAATAHSVIAAHCTPVFVDANQRDCHMSLEDAERRLTQRTRAMIVVHTLGFVADYRRYEEFAVRHGLILIFDSAAALGASYDEQRRVGTAGDCEVFSLHATKTFGIGEGGLLTGSDPSFLQRCRQIMNMGFNAQREVETHGLNAKLSDFHAAIGLSTLDTFDVTMAKKRRAYRLYKRLITESGISVRILGGDRPYDDQGYWMMPIVFDTEMQRRQVIAAFDVQGIGSRVYYTPLHGHPYFERMVPGEFPGADSIGSRILSIPLFEEITDEQIQTIVGVVAKHIAPAYAESTGS